MVAMPMAARSIVDSNSSSSRVVWRLCVIVASKNRRLYRLSPKLTLILI